MRGCAYYGAAVDAHEPIVVYEDDVDGPLVGRSCTYACLTADAESVGLAQGAACAWKPGETT